MPPERARQVAVSVLGGLARMPLGLSLIDLLGHMRADARLRTQVGAISLPGPVGLGALIDPEGAACAALGRFGVGFVELGPVGRGGNDVKPQWRLDLAARTLTDAGAEPVLDVARVATRLGATDAAIPIWVRLAAEDPVASAAAVERLRAHAAAFLLELNDGESCEATCARIRAAAAAGAAGERRAPLLLLSIRADCTAAAAIGAAARAAGAAGVFVRGETRDDAGQRVLGAATQGAVERQLRALRAAWPEGTLIVAGGVMLPDDVRAFRAAGADLCAVDAGLVCSGPGLIKRCNEALLLSTLPPAAPEALSLEAARRAWFWALMLGVAMLVGGALAAVIASTRVVLPYDESLCGMTRAQLAQLNPRLLPFMAHDRVTLAGTMLSAGVLYAALAWNGLRRGQHWAQVTVVVSAASGFFSFFLFLGFGYFDPFHAFVTAILFQFLLLCLVMPMPEPHALGLPEWRETAAWRRGQWGQLLFIAIGVGLLGAGLVITWIGCTEVFVQTDLEFLRTTAARLLVAHERLVPLVAHDRASLGGMLIANGLAVWLSAQWGFRAGARWLWRAFAAGGSLAFGAALAVHFAVGYTSPLHLAPAIAGWVIWAAALALTRDWLHALPLTLPPATAPPYPAG